MSQALVALQTANTMFSPPVRLPRSADEGWLEAKEKQPTLAEIKTKDERPIKILHCHGDHTVTASVWIQKQEGGTSQHRFGLVPWK